MTGVTMPVRYSGIAVCRLMATTARFVSRLLNAHIQMPPRFAPPGHDPPSPQPSSSSLTRKLSAQSLLVLRVGTSFAPTLEQGRDEPAQDSRAAAPPDLLVLIGPTSSS
jgi:hypothetical protein